MRVTKVGAIQFTPERHEFSLDGWEIDGRKVTDCPASEVADRVCFCIMYMRHCVYLQLTGTKGTA